MLTGPTGLQLWDVVGSCSLWQEPSLPSQDLLEAVLRKKKGKKSEKKQGDGACVWLTSEDPGEEGLDVENWVFSQFFVCGGDRAQTCVLLCGVQLPLRRLLRGLSFPWCMRSSPSLWINWVRGTFLGSLHCPSGPCTCFHASPTLPLATVSS